jgi:hypothetical protein
MHINHFIIPFISLTISLWIVMSNNSLSLSLSRSFANILGIIADANRKKNLRNSYGLLPILMGNIIKPCWFYTENRLLSKYPSSRSDNTLFPIKGPQRGMKDKDKDNHPKN